MMAVGRFGTKTGKILAVILAAGVATVLTASLLSCGGPSGYLDDIRSLAQPGEKEPSDDEIEKAIAKYRGIVEGKVAAAQQLGYYHKLQGVAYMRKGMYTRAVDSFRLALQDSPRSPGLYWFIGTSSALIAKGLTGPEPGWEIEAKEGLEAAERNFRKALEIEPNYGNALYSLAVLLVFDLSRPEEAGPLLERYLAKNAQSDEARMVLARVRYSAGELQAAMEMYDQILARNEASGEMLEQARTNLERLRAEAGGGSSGD